MTSDEFAGFVEELIADCRQLGLSDDAMLAVLEAVAAELRDGLVIKYPVASGSHHLR